MKQGTHQEMR